MVVPSVKITGSIGPNPGARKTCLYFGGCRASFAPQAHSDEAIPSIDAVKVYCHTSRLGIPHIDSQPVHDALSEHNMLRREDSHYDARTIK